MKEKEFLDARHTVGFVSMRAFTNNDKNNNYSKLELTSHVYL